MKIEVDCGVYEMSVDPRQNKVSFKKLSDGTTKTVTLGLPSRGYEGRVPGLYHAKHELGDWDLYILTSPGPGWGRVKLVRREGRWPKANYWLGYHYVDDRFSHTGDSVLLQKDPIFAEAVRLVLQTFAPKGRARTQYATKINDVDIWLESLLDGVVVGEWGSPFESGRFKYDLKMGEFIEGADRTPFYYGTFSAELAAHIMAWALGDGK